MDKSSLMFIVGARPNFIKIAPICRILQQEGKIPFKIVHTGQHYDQVMSDIFFEELSIPAPDFNLSIGSSSHGRQTALMMIEIEKLCLEHSFSAIVVIGDVNSTIAGALVGAKLNIPVVHIESGLRSFNRTMPEEINRIATDHVSDLLFAPTRLGMENLAKEGLSERAVFSGDVMYDMILQGLEIAREKSDIINQLDLTPGEFYLATLHRPYNVDDPQQLEEILKGLKRLDRKILLSAHPRLRKNLEKFDLKLSENIHLSTPLGYLDFITLEQQAVKVITDSGGVQKEAFFVQTPCVTLRPETEWVETVEAGANELVVERTEEAIVKAVESDAAPNYGLRPYGDGKASEIILNSIFAKYY